MGTAVTGTLSQQVTFDFPDDGMPIIDAQARESVAAVTREVAGLRILITEGALADDARLDALEAERANDDAEQAEFQASLDAMYAELRRIALLPDDDDDDEEARASVLELVGRITEVEAKVGTGPTSPGVPAPASNDILLKNVLPLGGDSNARLTEALRLQALDPARVIRFTFEDHGRTFTKTNTYNGKPPRIVGPCCGLQNPEQGVKPQVLITVNVGSGDQSWFVGLGQTFNVMLTGMAIKCDTGLSQLWHHPYSAGTAYAGFFHDVTLYGFKHGWGKPGDAFSNTLCLWSGAIQFPGIKNTALALRGSDSWYVAMTNLDANLGGGRPLVSFEAWTKCHARNLYLTARGDTKAVRNESSNTGAQGGTYIESCVIEGHNANDPAWGALIDNVSGHLFIDKTPINFGMANPQNPTVDTALVRIRSGWVHFDKISTSKANSVKAADAAARAAGTPEKVVPFAHVSDGVLVTGSIFPGNGDPIPEMRESGTGKINPPLFTIRRG